MDWLQPLILLLALPALALALWFHRRTVHPMSPRRRRLSLLLRSTLLVLILLALAGPAWNLRTREEAVLFVMDHSQSLGAKGMKAACERASGLASRLPGRPYIGYVSAGASTVVRRQPERSRRPIGPDESLLARDGAQTDLASAVALAAGLFPPGTARRLVLVTDGVQTRGDLEDAARNAAVADITIDAVPIAGDPRPDVRVIAVRSSRARLHEGASVSLTADIESSMAGTGRIRLFENGIEVEAQPLTLAVGDQRSVTFRRTPDRRGLYNYRVRVEGFPGDAIPENDEAMTLVDVRGRPLVLYVEGQSSEAHYLADAMAREGIRLDLRPPQAIPDSLQDLAAYDAAILSDVPAHQLTTRLMSLLRDYVEQLGGGFLMIGGKSSFGAGGYYRTPIEDILPVKLRSPDIEERHAVALILVIDRSGSMQGIKIEICKSAAIATLELLNPMDYIGVVAFDTVSTWIVPVTRATSKPTLSARISTINAGGGTNMYPAMLGAYEALHGIRAKAKHMLILTDGQTEGSGFQALASQIQADGITISTVAIGTGADVQLLQSIAELAKGKCYFTNDPANIPRIFTQDAMTHLGRLIREEAFTPKQVSRHPMLKGFPSDSVPQLLGYVKTRPKATAQVPLVTDTNDPLLAHWRFGLGKVTAFTSDCSSRWAALWITGWQSGPFTYGQFWAQVIRETAREPQGEHMDIHLDERGNEARIAVDLLEDAARFKNEAAVEADVFFVPAQALGSSMKPLARLELDQVGPGRYTGHFVPTDPGVYLVRARAGADLVSAGLVHNVSGEAAAGRTNLPLLEKVCELTGGTLLRAPDALLPPPRRVHSRFVELSPFLLGLLIAFFLADLGVRRWENVLGMLDLAAAAWRALRREKPRGP